tara:strand:+ start:460 stop:1551 length:1092 start_codon:yes stop_codon:yes gene_type:complete
MKVLLTGGHEEYGFDMRRMYDHLGYDVFEPGLFGVDHKTGAEMHKRPFASKTTDEEFHHHNQVFGAIEGDDGWQDLFGDEKMDYFTNSPNLGEFVYDRCRESVEYLVERADFGHGLAAQYAAVFAPHMPFIWHFHGQQHMKYYRAIEWMWRHDGIVVSYCQEEADLFPDHSIPVIQFAKDPDEWFGWNFYQTAPSILYAANDLQARKGACHYDEFMATARTGQWTLTGKNNEALGGDRLDYETYKHTMRNCRAFFNLGTVPATYTLSIIEAAMTGMPILTPRYEHPPTCPVYSVPRIFGDAIVVGSIRKLNRKITKWLAGGRGAHKEMDRLSQRARETAKREFGIDVIWPKWQALIGDFVPYA